VENLTGKKVKVTSSSLPVNVKPFHQEIVGRNPVWTHRGDGGKKMAQRDRRCGGTGRVFNIFSSIGGGREAHE